MSTNPDLNVSTTIEIPMSEYIELKRKANDFDAMQNGYKLQSDFFTKIRNEIAPTDKDIHLPWYEMLYKCIKNRQFKN